MSLFASNYWFEHKVWSIIGLLWVWKWSHSTKLFWCVHFESQSDVLFYWNLGTILNFGGLSPICPWLHLSPYLDLLWLLLTSREWIRGWRAVALWIRTRLLLGSFSGLFGRKYRQIWSQRTVSVLLFLVVPKLIQFYRLGNRICRSSLLGRLGIFLGIQIGLVWLFYRLYLWWRSWRWLDVSCGGINRFFSWVVQSSRVLRCCRPFQGTIYRHWGGGSTFRLWFRG